MRIITKAGVIRVCGVELQGICEELNTDRRHYSQWDSLINSTRSIHTKEKKKAELEVYFMPCERSFLGIKELNVKRKSKFFKMCRRVSS